LNPCIRAKAVAFQKALNLELYELAKMMEQ